MDIEEIKWRCQTFFSDYCAFVRDWDVKPHQRTWYSAFQALADGTLRHPDSGSCDRCQKFERMWIKEYSLPYLPGFRAECGTCKPTNKLMILAFFGSGKSDTLIEFNEWMIGKSVESGNTPQLGWVSYAEPVAADRSVAVRDTISSNERYQLVFPNCVPAKKKGWGETEWFLSRSDPGKKDATFKAAGINGSFFSARITTLLSIDDPQDPVEIKSETYRNDTWKIHKRVVSTRAAQGVTPFVVIANRHSDDDMPGRLMEAERDWRVIVTPALNENDEAVFPQQVHGGTPMGASTEYLHQLREEDPVAFQTGYMCQPPSEEGHTFQHFTMVARPQKYNVKKVVQFWDTATTTKSQSDSTAMCEAWLLDSGWAFINKIINVKQGPMETMQMIADEYWRSEDDFPGKTLVLVEAAHAGHVFAEQVRKDSGARVKLHELGGHGVGKGKRGPMDLGARANPAALYFETGQISLPREWEPWKDKFLQQMKSYGVVRGGHDDMVAAAVGCVEHLFIRTKFGRPPVSPYKPAWAAA